MREVKSKESRGKRERGIERGREKQGKKGRQVTCMKEGRKRETDREKRSEGRGERKIMRKREGAQKRKRREKDNCRLKVIAKEKRRKKERRN